MVNAGYTIEDTAATATESSYSTFWDDSGSVSLKLFLDATINFIPTRFARRVAPQTDALEMKFNELAETWKHETGVLSDVEEQCEHWAYQRIIAIGQLKKDEIIPLILRDLKATYAKWFWALTEITGEDPISDEYPGDIAKMTEAWLEWGKANGYYI